ncbi:MAG: bifunctional ADP-heptose synthase [Acidobacteriota bacterium]
MDGILSPVFSRARLLELTSALNEKMVLVYGDIVADRFIYGTPKRISREAPVLILRQYQDDVLLGGGGNAINNLRSLGGLPVPVSVVGNDLEGSLLMERLASQGIDSGGILRLDRYRTPTKVRVLGGMPHAARQQIVRYDIEDELQLTDEEVEQFAVLLREQIRVCDGALISDYGYGVVSPFLVSNLTGLAGGKPVTLDSRYSLLKFSDVTAATPNEDEASAATGIPLYNEDQEENLRFVGESLRQGLDAEAVLITRGSKGMALFEREERQPLMIPIYGSDQIADVTGAGDTVIAAFTLALAAGGSFAESARLANYAGGIVVMKSGTATVSNDELRSAIEHDGTLND